MMVDRDSEESFRVGSDEFDGSFFNDFSLHGWFNAVGHPATERKKKELD